MVHLDSHIPLSIPLPIFLAVAYVFRLAAGTSTTTLQEACDNGNPFSLVYWEHKPYIFKDQVKSETFVNGALPNILRSALEACCKKGANISFAESIEFPVSLRHVIENQSLDIILPVGRRLARAESVFLRPFLGLVESPGMAVVLKKSISGADLLTAIFDSWPIVVFIGMCLLLSGIIIWVLVRSCLAFLCFHKRVEKHT